MTDLGVQRRLTTVVAADIVGYSRLIEQDEAGTLAAIKARGRTCSTRCWPSTRAASSS